MGYPQLVANPTLMLGDNAQADRWAREAMVTNGNRHIERDFHKIKDDPGKCITHSLFLIYYKPTNPHFYTTKVQLPKYRYRVLESTRYNY